MCTGGFGNPVMALGKNRISLNLNALFENNCFMRFECVCFYSEKKINRIDDDLCIKKVLTLWSLMFEMIQIRNIAFVKYEFKAMLYSIKNSISAITSSHFLFTLNTYTLSIFSIFFIYATEKLNSQNSKRSNCPNVLRSQLSEPIVRPLINISNGYLHTRFASRKRPSRQHRKNWSEIYYNNKKKTQKTQSDIEPERICPRNR